MKKFSRIVMLALAFLMVAAIGGTTYAQAPSGSWASGIACVNLDDAQAATVLLGFYEEGSATAVLSYPDTIAAGGSKTYFTPSTPPGVPAGFVGSVVVSSDTAVSCSVNTQKQSSGTASDPYRIGTSAGVDSTQAAPTMYAPQLLKIAGSWNSYVAVQNTTNASVDVTVTYTDTAGNAIAAATENETIPAQSNIIFYQGENANLPNGYVGAATISADDTTSDLAVVVNFYNSGSSSGTAQFHSYNGFASGANTLFVPRIVRNFYGYNGGLAIQNIGTGDTVVKVTFSFAGTTYEYNSGAIASGASSTLYAPTVAQLNPVDALPEGNRFGSAVIEVLSGGPVVAIVNEDNRGGAGVPATRVGQGSTYNAIADGQQTNTIFFPQVARNAGGIFSGGFQVANTTATDASCDISYVGAPAANETNVFLSGDSSLARFAPSVASLSDGFNSGVQVSCNQPIVGISNLAVNANSGRYGDSFTQGNGLNR